MAMTGEADPFAAIRAMDDEGVMEARERDDEWGAMVRVVDDIARDKRPAPEDCKTLGLPYDSSGGAFERATPTPVGLSVPGPTRAQVRPLAQIVVSGLRQREE